MDRYEHKALGCIDYIAKNHESDMVMRRNAGVGPQPNLDRRAHWDMSVYVVYKLLEHCGGRRFRGRLSGQISQEYIYNSMYGHALAWLKYITHIEGIINRT